MSLKENNKTTKIRQIVKNIIKNKKYVIIFAVLILIIISLSMFLKPKLETIKDSVVLVNIYDDNEDIIATGSGFSAYQENWIVTNYHVIENASNIKVVTDDNKEYAVNDIIIFDIAEDLAIISIEGKLKPLKLGNGKSLKSTQKVIAIGSPMGEKNTISEGIISNADENDVIRITAPISHGSSGGVLLNSRHRVIGITSAGYDNAQNLNFAINVEKLRELYKNNKNGKYYKITPDNLDKCLEPDDDLRFAGCNDSNFSAYKSDPYYLFYGYTNIKTNFENSLTNLGWYDYNLNIEFDKEVIDLAYEEYKEIISYDYCLDSCEITKDIKKWSVNEFMINLKVLKKEELALIKADLENYETDDSKFNRVEEYPLDAYQKTLILYLIGDRSWNIIHKDNKEDIFNYFDENYNTKELGAILELLGYEVEYNNDDTLTAYW